jgi:hypothetical protein
MAKEPALFRLFGGLHKQMEAELGLVHSAVDHSGSKGTGSEDAWITMLTKHLPERYCISRGFVIDSRNGVSKQQDIIVHDRQYSPFVLNHESNIYVPSESVYAVLESKQSLTAENIVDAAEKIGSVRELHRTSIPIKHAGGEFPAKPLHYILGGIVALESDWKPPFGDPLRGALSAARPEGRIDIGCAVRHGVFGVKYSPNEPPAIAVETSSSSLALMLLRLIAALQSIATVPCIDVLAYAASVTTDGAPK